jgi:hypothetical protein
MALPRNRSRAYPRTMRHCQQTTTPEPSGALLLL